MVVEYRDVCIYVIPQMMNPLRFELFFHLYNVIRFDEQSEVLYRQKNAVVVVVVCSNLGTK